MGLLERNQIVIKRTRHYVSYLGLKGKLALDPIENTFKRRPHYYKGSDGLCYFTAFLWQMNRLDDDALAEDIAERVMAARLHFGL